LETIEEMKEKENDNGREKDEKIELLSKTI